MQIQQDYWTMLYTDLYELRFYDRYVHCIHMKHLKHAFWIDNSINNEMQFNHLTVFS